MIDSGPSCSGRSNSHRDPKTELLSFKIQMNGIRAANSDEPKRDASPFSCEQPVVLEWVVLAESALLYAPGGHPIHSIKPIKASTLRWIIQA